MDLLQELRELASNGKLETLTLEKAKKLQGKRIQTIYFGYAHQDGVDDFIVGEIISEYELALRDTSADGFENRAKYWESYMTPSRLHEVKTQLVILTKDNRNTYIRTNTEGYYANIFWCSDSDRFVQFRVVEDEN